VVRVTGIGGCLELRLVVMSPDGDVVIRHGFVEVRTSGNAFGREGN
jgi:hypothetical protein